VKRYKIVGNRIIVFSICQILPDEKGLENYKTEAQNLYTYQKLEGKVYVYRITPDIIKEVKEIENFYQYKIIPYQSCVLNSIKKNNFLLIDEESERVIISLYTDREIRQPTQISKKDFEQAGGLQGYKQFLGNIQVEEIYARDVHIIWDSPVEFLFPETIQYREKIEGQKEKVFASTLNLVFIGFGLFFLVNSILQKNKIEKEYQQALLKQTEFTQQKQQILTNLYRTELQKMDVFPEVKERMIEILNISGTIPDSNIEKIEFNNEGKVLKATITTPRYTEKVKEKFKNASINFQSGKVVYEIQFQIGEQNDKNTIASNNQR